MDAESHAPVLLHRATSAALINLKPHYQTVLSV